MRLGHIHLCFFWPLQIALLRCVSPVILIGQKHSDNYLTFQINFICCFSTLSPSEPARLFVFNKLLFQMLIPSRWNCSFCLAWIPFHFSGVGSLLARFQLTEGPSKPAPLAVQFTSEGSTLSGCDIELAGPGYRFSLIKKRFAAGQFRIIRLRSFNNLWQHFKPPKNSFSAV